MKEIRQGERHEGSGDGLHSARLPARSVEDQLAELVMTQRLEIAHLRGGSFSHAVVLDKEFPAPTPLCSLNCAPDCEVEVVGGEYDGERGVVVDIEGARCTVEFWSGKAEAYTIPLLSHEPSPLMLLQPTVVLSREGQLAERAVPLSLYENLVIGERVKVAPSGAIVSTSSFKAPGAVAQVIRALDAELLEVDIQGNKSAVRAGQFAPREGAFVILDPSNSIVTEDLGRSNKNLFLTEATNVKWEDVGGLEYAKAELIEAINGAYTDRELYEYVDQSPLKGILLWGPPGCGKTLLGKAAATAMAALHGAEAGSKGFIYVKSPALLDKWVGSTEGAIRSIFKTAEEFYQEHGYPPLIFFDEIDAIGKTRGTGLSSDVNDSIVPALLTEMDGIEASHALVVLATNRPDILDSALIRPERIDRKIQVPRPGFEEAMAVVKIHLGRAPVERSIDEAARIICTELFDDRYSLLRIGVQSGGRERSEYLRLRDIASGALIKGVCKRAKEIAIRRMRVEGKSSPLRMSEFIDAIEATYQENLALKHIAEVQEFNEAKGILDAVTKVERVRSSS